MRGKCLKIVKDYAIITLNCLLYAFAFNCFIVYGSTNAKLAYVISDKSDEIKQKLIDMELGVTIFNGSGAFTGNRKNILMCAAKPNKIAHIKAAVMELDPKGFVIVTNVKEVLGEGFGEYNKNGL